VCQDEVSQVRIAQGLAYQGSELGAKAAVSLVGKSRGEKACAVRELVEVILESRCWMEKEMA